MIDWPQRLNDVSRIAREAGELAMEAFRGAILSEFKAGDDLVTQTDRDVELLVRERLSSLYPGESIFGEEFAGVLDRDATWVIDPIDGTTNFARGVAHWCVSIAIVRDARPILGVIFDPCHNELFAACPGSQATLNGVPIACTQVESLRRSLICFGYAPKAGVPGTISALQSLAMHGVALRAQGAGALSIAHVAAGRLDGFFETQIFIWDVAAAVAILNAAGGEAVYGFSVDEPDAGFSFVGASRSLLPALREIGFPFG